MGTPSLQLVGNSAGGGGDPVDTPNCSWCLRQGQSCEELSAYPVAWHTHSNKKHEKHKDTNEA